MFTIWLRWTATVVEPPSPRSFAIDPATLTEISSVEIVCPAPAPFLLRGARSSRLQIDPEGFTWCGFVGAEQSLRWQEIHQLLPPPPTSRRVVAIAQLRDGRQVEVRALWESPTSPAVLLGRPDHSRAQNALLGAHRAWLAGHR